MSEVKKYMGVTDSGAVLYVADTLPKAEALGVTYQIKHKIKINPRYKSGKKK